MKTKSRPYYQEEIIKCIGKEYVETSLQSLEGVNTATFKTFNTVEAIIYPGNKDEIIECLKIANQYKKTIYPISKGKNWGYGSRVPTQNGSIILSLERLDTISDYNEQLAYVTVEAGVSFDQLNQFLREKNSNLMLSAPGTTPEASVIGNLLERGVVQGVYADRCNFFCGLEVITPEGEYLNTGLKSFKNSKASNLHKWGIGPSLDGLFIQSNLGVVISATLWLVPMPKFHQQFHFKVSDNENLNYAINQLQQLKLKGTLRASCSIFNDYRLLTMMQKFPYEKTDQFPLSTKIKKDLLGDLGEGWFLLGAIDGETELEIEAKRSIVGSYLKKTNSKIDYSELNTDNSLFSFEIKSGVSSVYWRKKNIKSTASIDPDKDNCGVIFAGFIAPFTGEHILEAIEIISKIMLDSNFEPAISIQAITDRSVCILSSILYDRDEVHHDEYAWNCYTKMLQEMEKNGYLPYRLTSESMNKIPKRTGSNDQILGKLKNLLDPNSILAPGRYISQKQ